MGRAAPQWRAAALAAALALLGRSSCGRADASVATLAPWEHAPQPNCSIIIDRHNHKNGGTTMREVFLNNVAAGRCVEWGYMMPWRTWYGLLDELDKNPPSGSTLLRACIELHFPVPFFIDDVPRLAALRERLRARGCALTLVTRVREPLSFYHSFYHWTVMGRQLRAMKCEADKAAGRPCTFKTKGSIWRWGRNFSDFVRAYPDLQSHLLFNASESICGEDPGPDWTHRYAFCNPRAFGARFGSAEQAKLFSALDQLDVVGSTEDFDLHLLHVQRLSGLPDVAYVRKAPKVRATKDEVEPVGFGAPMVCPDRARCAELVRAAAPRDHELWARYGGEAYRRRAHAALGGGPAVEGRVAQLREHVARLEKLATALDETGRPGYEATTLTLARRGKYCMRSRARGKMSELLSVPLQSSPSDKECMPMPLPYEELWRTAFHGNVPAARMSRAFPFSAAWRQWARFAGSHGELLRELRLPIQKFPLLPLLPPG